MTRTAHDWDNICIYIKSLLYEGFTRYEKNSFAKTALCIVTNQEITILLLISNSRPQNNDKPFLLSNNNL